MLAGLISSEEEVSEEEISEINKMIKTYDPQPNEKEEEYENQEEVKELQQSFKDIDAYFSRSQAIIQEN